MQTSGFIKFAALAVAGVLSQGAFAADGTINFTGEITSAACSLSPNSQNLTVPLGKVSKNVFTAVGVKSTPAKFTIDLLGCDATATGATVTFDGTRDALVNDDLAIGIGEVDGSAAKGVAIELGDSAGTKVPLGQPSGQYTLVKGDNPLKFQAAYVSTVAAVTPGQANATAQFTINYK